MGENEVQMESTEDMQEPHASSSDKIDLSLDDIIKLNKKEQKANRSANRAKTKRIANRSNILKKLNQAPQQQRGVRRGALQYQGPGRVRGLRRGSRRGMVSRGASLNRATANVTTGGQFDQTTFTSRGTFRGRGRGRGRGLSRGSLSARGQRGGRPFLLDRGYSATQRAEKLQRYQTIRSRRTAPSGSTLTVSLPNAKSAPVAVNTSSQARKGGVTLRGRPSRGAGTSLPKGIPLQFNYKATSNQTAVSLNDRFTGLSFRGRGHSGGRGAAGGRGNIGGGRGAAGGRGNIVGGGRGRGRGYIDRGGRGRGRGYIDRGGRGRGRGYIDGGGRGRGRGNIVGGVRGRGRGGIGGRGRGLTRGRGASRTVTLQ